MPKIQVVVTSEVQNRIDARVEKKINEGATKYEANRSSEAAKLLELGLRVQELQEAKKESTFNQVEFNKEVLRQLSVACAASQMLLGVASYNNEIKDMEKFKYSTMMKDVKLYSEDILAHFFPSEEDLSEE